MSAYLHPFLIPVIQEKVPSGLKWENNHTLFGKAGSDSIRHSHSQLLLQVVVIRDFVGWVDGDADVVARRFFLLLGRICVHGRSCFSISLKVLGVLHLQEALSPHLSAPSWPPVKLVLARWLPLRYRPSPGNSTRVEAAAQNSLCMRCSHTGRWVQSSPQDIHGPLPQPHNLRRRCRRRSRGPTRTAPDWMETRRRPPGTRRGALVSLEGERLKTFLSDCCTRCSSRLEYAPLTYDRKR